MATALSLKDKHRMVQSLWMTVNEGGAALATVPGIVRNVITSGAWAERDVGGRIVKHSRFIDFITVKPVAGCGWPPEKVEALIRDDPEVLALWREAVTGQHGGDRSSKADNISLEPGHGTSRSYTLSRPS
jgi:hypothetical protein